MVGLVMVLIMLKLSVRMSVMMGNGDNNDIVMDSGDFETNLIDVETSDDDDWERKMMVDDVEPYLV